jgi:hypothetical protein
MSSRRALILLAVAAAVAAASVTVLVADADEDEFDERPVPVSALPETVRDEIRAHGGARCVEQRPGVFRCVLATAMQAHEGSGGRVWCYDLDGARNLDSYPADVTGGRCSEL